MVAARIRYVDPKLQDHRDYHDHLQEYNRGVQLAVDKELSQIFPQGLPGAAVFTPGSDGRLEKGPGSQMEFIVISDAIVDPERVKNKILGQYDSSRMPALENIETKLLGGKTHLSEFYIPRQEGDVTLVSPARMFDTRYLFGDMNIIERAKQAFIAELQTPYGATVQEHVTNRVRDHRRATTKGTQRYKGADLHHYDLEGGVAFYNPELNQQSFKQGPIRLVQYALVRDLIKIIRETEEPDDVEWFPSNTVAKLRSLEVRGITRLDSEQVRDLADTYKYFLWLYHLSQDAYEENHTTTLEFDSAEVKDRIKFLEEVSKGTLLDFNALNIIP